MNDLYYIGLDVHKKRGRELERGSRNRATLAVARKLVAYLLAVDPWRDGFELCERGRLESARGDGAFFARGPTTGKDSLSRLRPPVAARVSDGRLRRETASRRVEERSRENRQDL